jgi:hypothetical protein
MSKTKKKDWKQINVKVPGDIEERIQAILDVKPHYTQQAIVIDAILAGLAHVEARQKANG